MLSSRLSATLCAITLLSTTACAPQSVSPQVDANTPAQSQNVQLEDDVAMDLVLTEEVDGVENPITPEQIESIEVDGDVMSAGEIEIETGAFTTAQAKTQSKLKVNYRVVANARKKMAILRLKKQKMRDARRARLIKIKYKSRLANKLREIQILRTKKMRELAKQHRLRFLTKQNGEVVGGASDDEGKLDPNAPKFKITANNKLEIFEKNEKKTFDPETPPTEDGEEQEESTTPATEEEQSELEVEAISPIAAFVGKWRANLLGKVVLAELSDEGSGRIGGTATVDGQSFSAAADYTVSADAPDTLQVSAQSPTGTTLTFEASVQEQNTLTLKLVDADNDPDIAPFLNVPVALKRDL